MVGMVGVAKSEQNKLSIFMSYNPFLLSNGITHKANPSLLMLTTSKLSDKKNYYYEIFILYYFYTQLLLVADFFLYISPHFIALDRHNL
jgi:hypothetical protein